MYVYCFFVRFISFQMIEIDLQLTVKVDIGEYEIWGGWKFEGEDGSDISTRPGKTSFSSERETHPAPSNDLQAFSLFILKTMAKLSGLQRDVLSLYRKCLREIRNKPEVGYITLTPHQLILTLL